MKNMTKKTKALTFIAITLTFVLVGVILFGVDVLRNRDKSVSGADAINLGDFTVPASNGTLGSTTNPFVVLEIVPSEDMAQFGYLVAGQEPINIDGIPAENLATVQDLISTQLSVSSTGYGTPFMAGFYNDVKDLLDKYSDKQSDSNQYGKYIYHDTDDQKYDLVPDTSVGDGGKVFVADTELSSYKYVESFDPDEFGTVGITTEDVPLDQVISDLPNIVDAPKLYDAETGRPLVYNVATGEYTDTLYVERTPGTGLLSDEKYENISEVTSHTAISGKFVDRTTAEDEDITAQSPLGGEYSFDYKYVGNGKGNYEYGLINGGVGGDSEGIQSGRKLSSFTLEATGFYMDMSGTRLSTEETQDTAGKNQKYIFTEDGTLSNGATAYNIYTGKSDYSKVLTANLTAEGDTYYLLQNGSAKMKLKAVSAGSKSGTSVYYLLTESSGYTKALKLASSYGTYSVTESADYLSANNAYFYFGSGNTIRNHAYPNNNDYLRLSSNGTLSITYSSNATKYTTARDYSGYLTEDNLSTGTGTSATDKRSRQKFGLEAYSLNGKTYYRIYCIYNNMTCYFTGHEGEEQIDVLSTKYEDTEKTSSISASYVYNQAETAYLIVHPVLSRTANVDGANRDIYYLYTQGSDFAQAITYSNGTGTTGLSSSPSTSSEFYLYTDSKTGNKIYCSATANGGYRYLYMNNSGLFEMYKTNPEPSEVELRNYSERYVEIKSQNGNYAHVVKLVQAGVDDSNNPLYYAYTDTSGFTKIVYININTTYTEQNVPSSDIAAYKFTFNGRTLYSASGNGKRNLTVNNSGNFSNENNGGNNCTELSDTSDYRILSNGTDAGVIKLVKVSGRNYYTVKTAKTGYSKSLYAEYSGGMLSGAYYLYAGTGSSSTYWFSIDNNKLLSYYCDMYVRVVGSRDCGFDVYNSSDYTLSTLTGKSYYIATVTNGTENYNLKAEPTSNANEYYLYSGEPGYSTQIYYNSGSVGTRTGTRRTNDDAKFQLVTEDGHKYFKVKVSSATLPYLCVEDAALKFTNKQNDIPGKVTTGMSQTVMNSEYVGFQLFERTEEDEIIKATFRYILNGGDNASGQKGRYLEINSSGNLIQNSQTIDYTDNDQVFAFVETGNNTGEYYIYTGHSDFKKVLTLSGTGENATISEANLFTDNSTKTNRQTFSLYWKNNETRTNPDYLSDYLRIRTKNTYTYSRTSYPQTFTLPTKTSGRITGVNYDASAGIIQYRDKKRVNNSNTAYDQWFKLVEVTGTSSLGFYEKAGGSYTDVSGESLLCPVFVGEYTYKNTANREVTITVADTGAEYTLKPAGQTGDSLTLFLGDYDKTYDGEVGPIYFEKVDGKVYGNFNYSKYILTTVAGGYKYAFTMAELTGEKAGMGHYEWVGYSYEECYGSSKIVTDTTQYPANVSVFVGLEGGSVEVSEADKATKFNELKSCQLTKVYTLYEGGTATTSADSFKKYAIGLAYVDSDYSKGLADIDYSFDGWYTDPYCMYKFNPEATLTKDTTLYARWECISPQEVDYKVTFDCNAYEKEADGTYKLDAENKRIVESGMAENTMPATVEKVRKDARISAPQATPIRSGYIFAGWYDDAECIWESEADYTAAKNAGKKSHDFTKPVTKDTTLYAGWTKLELNDVFTLEFNGNQTYSGMSSVKVVSVPAIVTNYARNGRICTLTESGTYNYSDITSSADFCDSSSGIMVPINPQLVTVTGGATDYVFAGWYYYATCEEDYRFDFNTTVTDDVHMTTSTQEVPDGEGGTRTVTTRKITLFAKWVKKTDMCTVSFDANIPAGAPAAEKVPSAVSVEYGKAIGTEKYQELVTSYQTTRKSDVQRLLDDYHVRVITVTPDDLNSTTVDNLELIDRANMIVINQTCSNKMRELWQNDDYRRPELFPKDKAYYTAALKSVTASDKIKTFVQKDFSWDTTMALFNKIAGIGTSACPVVFDYTAYTNALAKAAKEVTTTAKYSDAETITNKVNGSNNNVYKLYLMTQQMNPITLYNAYIYDTNNQNNKNEISTTKGTFTADWLTMTFTGESTTTKGTYWNKYTLVPYNAMTQADHQRDGLGVIGVTDKPEISNSSIDSSALKTAQLRNRVLLFNSKYDSASDQAANMVAAFETLTYESIGEEELNAYLCPDTVAPTSYKTSDIMYYMIRNTGMYTNFAKNLSVLEIEAGDSWKDSSYWFWYISRYVPNYTGTSVVTTQSTYELVGDIDDLNAAYDVIYFGVNLDPRLDSYYKKTMPGETKTARYNVGDIVTIELGQTISADFYRPYDASTNVIKAIDLRPASAGGKDGYERINNIPWAVECEVKSNVCTPDLYEPNIGAYESTYGLVVNYTPLASEPADNSFDCYKYYDKDNDKNYYFSAISIVSSYKTADGTVSITRPLVSADNEDYVEIKSSWHENGSADNSTTMISFREAGTTEWKKGYIQLDEFASKITSEYKENLIWDTDTTKEKHATLYSAGSYAYAGEKIKLAGYLTSQIATGNIYLYAHIGSLTSSKSTRLGVFDRDDGADDDLNMFAYSGNDITQRKYEEMIDFVKAGYPVIVCSNLLNVDGEVDTKKVDSSSYIYKFLTELRTNYPSSCYIDSDTTRDDQFVDSLKNKTFDLQVLDKPTEYVDKTYEDPTTHNRPYASYTEDQIYVNGAQNGSNANINNRDLTFQIYIDSTKPSGYYKLRLYIDANADGRFNEEEERLDTLEISVTSTGKTANADRLLGNTNYTINRRVVEYAGILPWKLEIIDGENGLIHDYVTGACAIKVEEKERVNVLQIIPDSGINVYLPTDGEYKVAKKLRGGDINETNASTYFKNAMRSANAAASTDTTRNKVTTTQLVKNAGMFYYYTTLLNEFEVHFYRMSVSEFKKLVTTGIAPNEMDVNASGNIIVTDESSHVHLDEDGDCTYFDDKDINMLILGYADCYTDIESNEACEYIESFIAAGNTTLFTHDTTSFVNKLSKTGFNGTSDIWWGYYINKYFRDILGMDRFGVMTNRGVFDENAPDWPFKLNTNQTQYATGTATKTGTKLINQGLTNVCTGQDGARIGKATKANDGQIVSYPFKIPDTLSVATTHSQYYQLNLDADDIVVWYCLYDTSSQYYATKNDVRNNYYIYNRGNITYSGVGHDSNMTSNEYKLFVNTMIAAYQASSLATEPVITNRDRSVDTGTDYLYVDYDATLGGSEAKPFGEEIEGWTVAKNSGKVTFTTPVVDVEPNCYTKEVHFTLKNYSIILNKLMTVHYYPVVYDAAGNRLVLEDCPLDLTTYEYDDIDEEWKPLTEANGGVVHLVKTEVVNEKNGVKSEPIVRITQPDEAVYSATSNVIDTTGTDIGGGVRRYTSVTKMTGSVVDSLKTYYVPVPITDTYYKMLESPTYQSIMEAKEAANGRTWTSGATIDKYALDVNNHFEIEIRVIMRYGRDPDKCVPLIGTRSAVFMRRGMFKLD